MSWIDVKVRVIGETIRMI